ncbi:response regulator transcription factor [Nocardioides acrostichi]|uniref:Response regulator n=1 Tax=Nocardioides acrostichi TaxID=2784339 RepID=A0A930Y8Y8_9ACTN|nr:response regulator [Nocardioides acrostichi]MBF4163566.1 response regulator [Nocardioides acrostichi]
MARILIAEDDEDLRLLLRLVVQRAGHEVEGVPDGIQALRAITKGGYDLVVLDNSMPGMTGLEVLHACADLEEASRPIMLMLSALATRQDIRRGYVAGADDFLAKPFSREELVERIHLLLDERAMQFAMGGHPGTAAGGVA